jgi:heavy metal sensor kinase
MPIRARLALAAAVATAAVFAITAVMFVRSFEDGLRDSVDDGLRVQGTTFVRQVERVGAGTDLRDRDNAVVATAEVVAQVLDAGGAVVDSTREAGSDPIIGREAAGRASGERVFADVTIDDESEPFRVLAAPLRVEGEPRVAVIGASLEATESSVGRVERALLIGGLAAIALVGVGAWFLAGAALRPVESMRRKAAAISAHDAEARLDVPRRRDELTALATTMNDLLARLQGALVQQKTLVADASHELRTPLAVLRAELELASRPGRTPDELRDAIDQAVIETERLIRLTEDLLFLAQDDEAGQIARRESVDVLGMLDAAVARNHDAAAQRDVLLRTEADADLRASLDAALTGRALDNLVGNAVRHAPAGSSVSVRATRTGDDIEIVVLDDGPGFPPDFLPHAFERFRRADDARSRDEGGTGLGLAIVRSVANAHGGTARAENRNGGGAAVALDLPDV